MSGSWRELYEKLLRRMPGSTEREKQMSLDILVVLILLAIYISPLPSHVISTPNSVLDVFGTIIILFIIPLLGLAFIQRRMKDYAREVRRYREEAKRKSIRRDATAGYSGEWDEYDVHPREKPGEAKGDS